ncbi:Regulator of RpoS [Pseudodesulfovibrio hydrargyri]|uniref:Regulator of RpoS n=1 Tax=Pseudodesulfovibrio hydrargyri TaxID=2125990 RepID=A0A1J5MQS0_9BACT|nr:response regulator [Pseudodesulfovibrio hydrargyri]OIQ48965.1 Regulator of RpoS [Pseudodesulfovibrio hydrargyri]
MTAITIFNGCFCDARPVVERVAEITGYHLVEDREIIADAAWLSGLNKAMIAGIFSAEGGDFGMSGPDRNQVVSWLRYAVARKLSAEKNLVLWGITALLAPRDCTSILSVCLVNETNDRLWTACRDGERTESEAREVMAADDRMRGEWVVGVTDCNDPWSETLYDMIVPVGALGARQSAYLVVEQLAKAVVRDTAASRARMEDFRLAAKVQAELARHGHDVAVSAQGGTLTLSLESHDSTLKNGTRCLFDEVSEFRGVRGVEIGTGQRYNPNDVFQRAALVRPYRGEEALEDAACTSACGEDAVLAETIRAHLPYENWAVSVFVRDGFVSLAVNDHGKLLERMARRVCGLATGIDGVSSVEFGVGREYHQGAACARIRRERCLAVLEDDKRKFVPTLSPRLRHGGEARSFALYDGKSAFYTMDEHEPEVVLLDMPVSAGTDVLRQFKLDHPETEVLVLADRAAEQDREACMNLGAFACLNKPVNTAALSETIRAACEKSRSISCP